MSLALVLAAMSRDTSTQYSEPVDYFRAICEGLMLLMITIGAIWDVVVLFK